MLKQKKYVFLCFALCSILLGLFTLIWPETSLLVLSYALGAVLACYGVFRIFAYLLQKDFPGFYEFSLVTGGLCLTVGVVILWNPQLVEKYFSFVLGCVLLISGFVKLQNALDLRRMNYSGWLPVLVLGLLAAALAAVIFIDPFTAANVAVMFIGGALTADGLMDLWSLRCLSRKIKELEKMVRQDMESD